MAWKLTYARYCLLFLALALHTEAARPHRSMHVLDLDEESTLAKLRFEAGDPACGRSQFLYECFDGPLSRHTPNHITQEEPAAFVEDAQVLPKDKLQAPSDCGPLGHHKFRCVPPVETTMKTPAPGEVAAVVVQGAQVLPSDRSDCGPLGQHKFRCVPPRTTEIKTIAPPTTPENVSPVDPSLQEAYQRAQSNCGPLSKEKYRCVPPMR